MKTLILIDRDGTVIYDKKYHLGRTNNWKSKVKILPKVKQGLKLLSKLKNTEIYMFTNQPGVAIKEFKLLTLKRAHEVCKYVLNKFKPYIKDYFICAHASPAYTKKRSEYSFDKKLVCNCKCIKPKLGMVFDALRKEGLTPGNTKIIIIGDRLSDIKTALNVKGTGILIPFVNEPEEETKVKKLKSKKVYIAKDFLDAAKFIAKNQQDS